MIQGTHGNTGIKLIVFMGIGTFLFLMLVSFGLRQSFKPLEKLRVPAGKAQSPFQAARAYADLEHLVALGPRPSGSPAMEAQQDYVARSLRDSGLRVRNFSFTENLNDGPTAMRNLVGIVAGSRPGIIALSTHFDTYPSAEGGIVGANDGASGTAWLLEMARVLGPHREGRSVWLIFLDGQETPQANGEDNALYGSHQLVGALRESGDLPAIEVAIHVNMIGDCYLALFKDVAAPKWLSEIVWNTAKRYEYGTHFGKQAVSRPDGNLAFRKSGVPALSLIDFSYGANRLDHGKNWRSANDTLEKVCPDSLRVVGDVIYHALPVIEGHLDTMDARSDGH